MNARPPTKGERYEDLAGSNNYPTSASRPRTNLSINQSLGRDRKYGSLYLNATDQRFWDGRGTRSLSGGYSSTWRDLNYSVGVSRNQSTSNYDRANADTQMTLSLSPWAANRARPAPHSIPCARAMVT